MITELKGPTGAAHVKTRDFLLRAVNRSIAFGRGLKICTTL
ncbi:MAG: hypothetical protein ABR607_10530 [Pyrinomonadaceae bacterium]